MEDKRIEGFLRKIKARIFFCTAVRVTVMTLTAGLLLWSVTNAVSLFMPWYYARLVGGCIFLVCQLIGLVIIVARRPRTPEAALKADKHGLEERLITSYELRGKEDSLSLTQKRDTIKKISRFNIQKEFPVKVGFVRVLVMMISGAMLFATFYIDTKAVETAEEQHELEEDKKEIIDELEQKKQELAAQYELTEEQMALLEKITSQAKAEVENAGSYAAVKKAEERYQTKLQDQLMKTVENLEGIKDLDSRLKNMSEGKLSLEEQKRLAGEMAKVAEEIQDEEMKETVEQMEKELDENGEVSDDIINQAKQQFGQAIDEFQNTPPGVTAPFGNQSGQQSGSGDGAQNGTQGSNGQNGTQGSNGQNGTQGNNGQNGTQGNNGQNGTQGSNGQDGTQGNNGQNGTQGNNGQDGSQGSNGQNGSQGNNGQDGSQGSNGQDGSQGSNGQDGSQGSNGQDGSQGNNGQSGSQGSDGQSGSQGSDGQSGSQGGNGQNGGQGSNGQSGGQGNGQSGSQGSGGQGDGQGSGGQGGQDHSGSGWNTGSNVGSVGNDEMNGERIFIPDSQMSGKDYITGKSNSDGESTSVNGGPSVTWSGESIDYGKVIGEYTNQAYEGLQKSEIPESMKDIVKGYFSELSE